MKYRMMAGGLSAIMSPSVRRVLVEIITGAQLIGAILVTLREEGVG